MKQQRLLTIAFALLFSIFTAEAHAEEPEEEPLGSRSVSEPAAPPAVNLTPSWYGYQTLLSDAASIGLLFVNNDGARYLGVAGYLAGAPIIHGLHGEGSHASWSVVLRLGMPVLGGVAGGAAARCEHDPETLDFCPLGQIAVGVFIGAFGAIAIDAAVLAWEKPKLERTHAFTLAPTVAVGHKQTTFGLAGTF